VEVGNAPIIDCVPLWGLFKSFLILEDVVLKTFDLFGEAMELHRSVSFVVGDHSEESVRDGAKERRVDVVIGSEG